MPDLVPMPALTTPFTLGEARTCGPLTVFAVHGAEPVLSYRTLAEALAHGAVVTECGESGVVDTLEVHVHNPTTGLAVLVFGEDDRPGDPEIAAAFLHAALHAARRPVAVPGAADGFAAESAGIEGGGLVHDGEMIALTAFPR